MKFKTGDIVKHKLGGPKMIIIDDRSWLKSHYDSKWEYECRYFVKRNTGGSASAASSSTFGNSEAHAEVLGDWVTKEFMEFELTKR